MLQCGIGVGGCDMASVRANTRFAPTSMVRRCPRRTIGHGVAMWHRCGRMRGSPLHRWSVGAYGAPLATALQCGIGVGEHEVRPYIHCPSVSTAHSPTIKRSGLHQQRWIHLLNIWLEHMQRGAESIDSMGYMIWFHHCRDIVFTASCCI